MSNNFFGQRYNNFLDNQIKENNLKDEKFSSPLYSNPKDEKESSDFVLQKMQLSLNNFLSNLKKNEMDSFPPENEAETIYVEKSFNFNNNILAKKNLFDNYPLLNSINEGFPRGKEKSESNLVRKSMNAVDLNQNGYFRSPFNQDRKQKGFSVFSNSMYSFNTYNANKVNKNLSLNNGGNSTSRSIKNNDILNIRQNDNISNNYNTYSYNANNNRKVNNNINNIISQSNKILINENSSYSSEENNNNKNNTIQEKINNNNNNNANLINSSIKAKKENLNSIINSIDNDYKKIVQKIKEKKANEQKLKEMENSANINITQNVNNKNNIDINISENYNKLNTSAQLNNLTDKKLKMMNDEILLKSNERNSKRNKNKSKNVKENLFFSKTYAENNENFSNSIILNKKRNSYLDIDIKKEYSKEKDNDNYNENYRTSKRKYKKHIEDQIILNDDSFNNKLNNYNTLSNNIKKVNYNGNSNVKINKIEEDLNGLNQPKIDLYNKDNENDNENLTKNEEGENESEYSKSKKLDITEDVAIHRNTQDLFSGVLKTQEPPKKEWMKTFSGSYYNDMSNDNYKTNYKKNINNENDFEKKMFRNVISVTKNNFEIINTDKEKNKILEKFMKENNSLKEKVKNNENEIQRLNSEKKNYMEYIGWDANKYQQKIQELESKLVDNKNIKGQLTILKSQKTNLYKDYSKYKDIAESLKKENDKLTKEKDEFKKQRDILNNEIKILKINNNSIGYHNSKKTFSKTISRQKLLTVQSNKSNNKINQNKRIKRSEDKKYSTIENESKPNNLYITVNKEHSILQFSNKNNIIVNNDTFSFMGNGNENFENKIKEIISNVDIESIDINDLKNKFKEIEILILEKEREREREKYKLESLNKENKDISKKIDKSKSKKKKLSIVKTEENKNSKANNANVKKYLDEINELKNNMRKLEIEKNSLKSKIENENKKNNNSNLQKQIDDLKKQVNHSNNQIKALKSKSNEFDEFFLMTKSFIKMIKPSDDKEKDLYFKLKNHIEFLDKEKK